VHESARSGILSRWMRRHRGLSQQRLTFGHFPPCTAVNECRVCPVCESPQAAPYGRYRDEEYFTSEELYDYWMCRDCGTVFLHPLPVAKLKEIYPPGYYLSAELPDCRVAGEGVPRQASFPPR